MGERREWCAKCGKSCYEYSGYQHGEVKVIFRNHHAVLLYIETDNLSYSIRYRIGTKHLVKQTKENGIFCIPCADKMQNGLYDGVGGQSLVPGTGFAQLAKVELLSLEEAKKRIEEEERFSHLPTTRNPKEEFVVEEEWRILVEEVAEKGNQLENDIKTMLVARPNLLDSEYWRNKDFRLAEMWQDAPKEKKQEIKILLQEEKKRMEKEWSRDVEKQREIDKETQEKIKEIKERYGAL